MRPTNEVVLDGRPGSAVLIMTEVNSSVKSMDLKVQTGIKTEEIDSLSYKFLWDETFNICTNTVG